MNVPINGFDKNQLLNKITKYYGTWYYWDFDFGTPEPGGDTWNSFIRKETNSAHPVCPFCPLVKPLIGVKTFIYGQKIVDLYLV